MLVSNSNVQTPACEYWIPQENTLSPPRMYSNKYRRMSTDDRRCKCQL